MPVSIQYVARTVEASLHLHRAAREALFDAIGCLDAPEELPTGSHVREEDRPEMGVTTRQTVV